MTQEEIDALKPDQETLTPKDETKFDDTGDFTEMDAEFKKMEEADAARVAAETAAIEDPDGTKAAEAAATAKAEEEAAAAAAAAEDPDAAAAAIKAQEEADAAAAAEVTPKVSQLDDIQLPEGASPKAGESFQKLKEAAAATIAERDTELGTLRGRVQELESATPTALTPEIEAELTQLREFRAKLDIEADPSFKDKFEGKAGHLRDFIYDQLKSAGVGDDSITKIKELGGPEKVNLDTVYKSLNNEPVKRLVEAKVNDLLVIEFDKNRAVKEAKDNVGKYIESRQEEYTKSVSEHRDTTNREVEALLPKLTFLTPAAPKPGAPAEAVAAHKQATEFAGTVRAHMEGAAADDSAKMRAILITGMGQLLYTKQIYGALSEAHKKLTTAHTDLQTRYDKIKTAGKSRLGSSSAPNTPVKTAPSNNPHMTASESMDNLRKEQEQATS
jgi:hypothetical protein